MPDLDLKWIDTGLQYQEHEEQDEQKLSYKMLDNKLFKMRRKLGDAKGL